MQNNQAPIRLWDLAVRLFHWSQLLLLGGLWYSAEQEWFGLHQTLAYLLAALLVARIVWGFVGSSNARFRQFWPTPARLLQYLREKNAPAGHNPLSALMILALLLLVLLQFLSGLLTTDDVMVEGPLYASAPGWLTSWAGSWHHLGFDLLLYLVGIHVLAALWHQWRGDKVISAMWHGRKVVTAQEPQLKPLWRYLALVAVALLAAWSWQGDLLWPQLQTDLQLLWEQIG